MCDRGKHRQKRAGKARVFSSPLYKKRPLKNSRFLFYAQYKKGERISVSLDMGKAARPACRPWGLLSATGCIVFIRTGSRLPAGLSRAGFSAVKNRRNPVPPVILYFLPARSSSSFCFLRFLCNR